MGIASAQLAMRHETVNASGIRALVGCREDADARDRPQISKACA